MIESDGAGKGALSADQLGLGAVRRRCIRIFNTEVYVYAGGAGISGMRHAQIRETVVPRRDYVRGDVTSTSDIYDYELG